MLVPRRTFLVTAAAAGASLAAGAAARPGFCASAPAPAPPAPADLEVRDLSVEGIGRREVFLRRPDLFAAWGGVQSAFGAHRAAGYADRIEKALASQAPRSIRLHLETSLGDPFREGNERLSTLLTKMGIANDLQVLPGPHDQPWLRESGTLEMLLWHDRMRPGAGAY